MAQGRGRGGEWGWGGERNPKDVWSLVSKTVSFATAGVISILDLSASLPLVPLHHLVPDLRLALGGKLLLQGGCTSGLRRAFVLFTAIKCGAMDTEPHGGRGRTSRGLLHFSFFTHSLWDGH